MLELLHEVGEKKKSRMNSLQYRTCVPNRHLLTNFRRIQLFTTRKELVQAISLPSHSPQHGQPWLFLLMVATKYMGSFPSDSAIMNTRKVSVTHWARPSTSQHTHFILHTLRRIHDHRISVSFFYRRNRQLYLRSSNTFRVVHGTRGPITAHVHE